MTLKLAVGATITGSVEAIAGLARLEAVLHLKPTLRFLTGAGADLVDVAFSDRRSLGSGASEDLDLLSGLVDVFGVPVDLQRLKAILVIADKANAHDLLLGGGVAAVVGPLAASSYKVRIRPGGFALMACRDALGWNLVAGAENLRFTNDGTGSSVTYTVVLLGVSDAAVADGVLDFTDPFNSDKLVLL